MLIPVVVAAALMNAAMVAASAVSAILIADDLGPALAGLPNTAGVLGTAAGAMAVGRWTARLGRAQALRTGYGVGVAGGASTVLAAVGGPVALLFVGMFLLGVGNAASLLSRYAAADAAPPDRRSQAMSTVIWASTIGAAGGPFLMAPSQSFASGFGLPAIAGPFLLALAAVFSALVASTYIRRTRSTDAPEVRPVAGGHSVLLAAGVMVVGQLVMVSVMTAVPVHTHLHHDGLGLLGVMLSIHTLGMFALSPLTGWCIDRFGPRVVTLAGLVGLLAAAVLVTRTGLVFTPALFLLGYAWNLCYLGGSAQLGSAELESRVESLIWTVSALATAASPWLFTLGGFPVLAMISVILAVPLLVLVLRRGERIVVPR
ncbi:MFS transporter [Kribbella jiaozuonensis]|uniref:MFS transporter n=1 Tax=Kribbella jiaozuonensis TaxID=2575441 RepID=A0A4U3LPP5_9ACTN|nr:MFS transporter [Kribbella jiaozuonensis]TKK77815.1 MFS transporter [Kribbella jiaozuonensis]